MSAKSEDELIDALIAREGGHVNDPRDAGGETRFGITIARAREHGYSGPMRTMPRELAVRIYRARYWTGPGLDKVAAISPAIAEELFDTGVNMGPGKAGELLQVSLNALNDGGRHYADIAEDGQIGPASLAALRAYLTRRGAQGESVLLKALNCLQGARYIELSRLRGANEAFVFGWLRERVGSLG